MTGTDVSGIDPAFNRAGITFDGIPGHAFTGSNRFFLTHPQAYPAMGAPVVVDHRFLLHQFDGVHRTIPHTKSAADAFVGIYLHVSNLSLN